MTSFLILLLALAGSPRTAEHVLDDYATALGGAKAWNKHKSVRIRRELEAKGMQIRGTEERVATSAGKMVSVTTIAGVGTMKQGSDGKVRWTEDPINGLRLLQGPEDEQARIDSTWDAELRLKAMYKEVHSVEPPMPPPAGQSWECVKLVPKLGEPATACFDAKTHLRVLQKGTHATPQGPVPYTAKFSDWREVGGVKVPHSEEMTAGPMTLEAKVAEVVFDQKVDPKRFAVPKPGKKQ